ncbi:MAG: hypothetical protein AAFN92_00410 [Bacteroidota bacterium]
MDVLKNFYRKTRPWGFWGPVLAACQADDDAVEPNRNFGRDAINVAAGIVWQTALTAAPIFLVIRYWPAFFVALAVAAGLTYFLKTNWYDKLEDYPADLSER